MPAARPASAALALVLACPALAAAVVVDPFYANLMRSGAHHYAVRDYENARLELRLACFGMLDDPPLLAECLARLALAQDRAGDEVGFTDTFRRIVDLEDRFGAWSGAPLPADLRAGVESSLAAKVPASTLAMSPGFSGVAVAGLRDELAGLSVTERRQRLDGRLAANPRDLPTLVLLAELELESGNPAAARRQLDTALVVAPRDAGARCLRGQLLAGEGDCASAREDLRLCEGVGQLLEPTRRALGCAVAAGDWPLARGVLAITSAELAANPEIAPLARQVPAAAAQAPPSPPPAPAAAPPAAPPPSPAANPAPANGSGGASTRGNGASSAAAPSKPPAPAASQTPRPQPAPSPPPARRVDLDGELAVLRERLSRAGTSLEAAALLPDAERLADNNPTRADAWYLAAEIAYRASRWSDVVRLVRRGGEPGAGQAAIGFYYAVSLFEAGQRAAAAAALRVALPGLQRTAFVDSYVARILGDGNGNGGS